MIENFDVIILGGGCAGLALARELSLRAQNLSVIVVEPRKTYSDDRTWCFWARGREELRPTPRATWARWQFSTQDTSIIHAPSDWRYCMVSSADYYADALSVIDANKQVQLLLGTSAGAITIDDGICRIATTAGPVMGRWVIDTRPPEPDWLRMAPLAQLFSGAEIEVDRDTFDPRIAMLMCDLRASDHVFAFDYILPLSPTRALIEHTVFTTRPHDPALLDPTCLAKVAQVCGSEARVLRQERGWLPMGLPNPPRAHEAIVHAGARGGALRPSSGYAFRRIQNWASRCADSFVSSGKPVTGPVDSATIEFMDHVFLEAMSKKLELAPESFLSIARALDGDGFARFMSDEARWTDWVKVIAALPKSRFLAAAGVSLSELKLRRRRPC